PAVSRSALSCAPNDPEAPDFMALLSYFRPLYGRRTSPVRVLSVVVAACEPHTVGMSGERKATAFVTGAGGFIGTELIKALVADGHPAIGLVRSLEAAERVRRAGAVPVMGDLLEAGQWQDEAAADWVF